MGSKLTTKEFIKKAIGIHGEKYDYSKTEYVNSRTKLNINCPVHGIFLQNPSTHLSNKGCQKCGDEQRIKSNTKTTEQFVRKSKNVHGSKYNYDKVKYTKGTIKVTITCPIHGDFSQFPFVHLNKSGCPLCGREEFSKKTTSSTLKFIAKGKKVHGDRYDYSKTNYVSSKTKVELICKEHGSFMQEPRHHLQGQNCPKCYNRSYSKTNWCEIALRSNIAILYIVNIFSNEESFIKIGISSSSVKRRFSGLKSESKYDYILIKEILDSPENIWNLEKNLHKYCKRYQYKPRVKFSGETECFKTEVLHILYEHL